MTELHVEQLLGTKVRDSSGRSLGRIEEFVVEERADGAYLIEVHLGPEALLERLGGAMLELPFISSVAKRREPVRVRWEALSVDPSGRLQLRQP